MINPSNRFPWRQLALATALSLPVIASFLLWETDIQGAADALLSDSGLNGSGQWLSALVIVSLLTLDVLLPVPSSLVSLAGGAMLGPAQGFAAVFIGMSMGSGFGYLLGLQLGNLGIGKLVKTEHQSNSSQRLKADGMVYLMACRAIPVAAEVSVLMAGVNRYSPAKFALATTLPNLLISLAYAVGGGQSWMQESALSALAVILLVPLVFMWINRLIEAKSGRATRHGD